MIKYIPNILTIGRCVLTLIFLAMVLYFPQVENPSLFLDIAFVVFLVAGLTDIADGPLARKLGVTSKFGRIMDPLADKVLVCGSFICFAIVGQPALFNFTGVVHAVILWSIAGILVAREVYITVLRHYFEAKGIDFRAVASGKIKMFIQSFAIGTVVIKAAHVPTATWGMWFTTVVLTLMVVSTVVSGITSSFRVPIKARD